MFEWAWARKSLSRRRYYKRKRSSTVLRLTASLSRQTPSEGQDFIVSHSVFEHPFLMGWESVLILTTAKLLPAYIPGFADIRSSGAEPQQYASRVRWHA